MIFNTFEFALFFVIVLALYLALSHRWQNRMLLVASYFFYGWWDWRFLSLLFLSTILDYFCGLIIAYSPSPRRRKTALVASMVGNLTLLGVFKYFNFFVDSFRELLQSIGLPVPPGDLLHIVLPVGISFYTFQTMSYTIDIYRGRLQPTRRFLDFALFVTFFPQLVAGPIERASNLLPQVLAPRLLTREKVYDGAWLMYWGLYKKVFVADNLAPLVDRIYSAPDEFSFTHILIATYAFAMQIYCDFSGYSDIARGAGKVMGFEIMLNFNLPYAAVNPSDFWRRWHLSLSQWLRDYLYIPLGGNRGTRSREYSNLMTTMTLGGLWHGASWHFVIWGIYHGLLLVGQRLIAPGRHKEPRPASRLGLAASMFAMFHLTCLGWILFRVPSMGALGTFVRKFATDWSVSGPLYADALELVFYSALVIVYQIYQYRKNDLMVVKRMPAWGRTLLYVLIYLSLVIGGSYEAKAFIYFQF